MHTFDEIVGIVKHRQDAQSPLIQRMLDVRDRYNGDYVIPLPSMEGEPIQSTTFAAKRVLVLGSEGEGLSKRAKSKVKEMVSIEMKHQFDSLNVSAAAAILIHRMGYAIR
jgi:23S rRNA (guanosine2251-2'-O)-methyltransferase